MSLLNDGKSLPERKQASLNKKPSTFNYFYTTLDGEKLRREDVVKLIKSFLRLNNNAYLPPIIEHCRLPRESVYGVLNYMVLTNSVNRSSEGRKRKYSLAEDCPLADLFYPKDKIEKSFKIKSRKVYKLENSKNVSYKSGGHITHYAGSQFDIVYD